MIRLNLVSLVSPFPPYGFWTTLVSMETPFRGESNAIGCKEFGGIFAEDIRNYGEINQLVQIRNIGAFLFQPTTHWTSPLCVKCSPTILSHL